MKIAVSATGEQLTSGIDPRFGRAAYFVIYDSTDDSFEAISNIENASAAQGAGIQAAQSVVNKKPDWVVSGNFGPKAFAALKAAGLKIGRLNEGTVGDAVKLTVEGKIEEIKDANVATHWRQ